MWVLENALGEVVTWYSEAEMQKYKQALEKIKEIITLDDINCKISKETQNVCNDVLTIINEVTKESEEK